MFLSVNVCLTIKNVIPIKFTVVVGQARFPFS